MDIGMGQIIVKKGGKFTVTGKNLPAGYYDVSVANGALRITEYMPGGLNLGLFEKSVYEVTVPGNTSFDYVNLNADMGKITAEGVRTGSLVITAAMGGVDIKDADAAYTNVDCSMGGVSVRGDTRGDINIICAMGGADIKSDVYGNLTIECAMGAVKFDGRVFGNITADCAMSGVEIKLANNPADFNYNLSSAMGTPKINGEDWKKYQYYGNERGKYNLNASSDMGGIKINFK